MIVIIRRNAPQLRLIAREYRKIRRCALTGRRRQRTSASLLVATVLAGCASLPPLDARAVSHAIEAPTGSALRAAVEPLAARHADQSGIYPLKDGPGAFAARVALVNAAVSSIDVQYYIWHDDTTGSLMFDALRRAADRGVRVRLLLDDLTTRGGLDGTLAALGAHANVQVRLFNPFRHRSFRSLDYLTDFSRLNRRMHNKSLTVDGVATIIGGRNIADEYFQAGEGLGYIDLDVLAIGAVVRDVSRSFDEFWSSASSYPAPLLIDPAKAADLKQLDSLAERARSAPGSERYTRAIRESQLAQDVTAGKLSFIWASTHLVVDDPAKGLGEAAQGADLTRRLEATLQHKVSEEFLIVSPFFVPRKIGRDMLTGLSGSGVRVRVLTNGAESADVDAACAAYRTYRKDLLRAGVELFELKRATAGAEPEGAKTSLHAKTFAIDRAQIYVGSFNFDPRSANLNTEIGLVIDSPELAGALSRAFEEDVPLHAYGLELEKGDIVWLERGAKGEKPQRLTHEPGAGFWRRTWLGFLALLPIEGEL
jgi:putative cardiolipin synthase